MKQSPETRKANQRAHGAQGDAMSRKPLTKDELFFHANAGYSYGAGETQEQSRQRCARELAAAEAKAREGGFTYRWSVDPHQDSREFNKTRPYYSVWQCAMLNKDGRVCASLHGIDFGRDRDPWMDSYKRVVEAELAIEGCDAEPQGRSNTYWRTDKG